METGAKADSSKNDNNPMITAGFILGIVGIVLSFIPFINFMAFVMGILALIFGVVGVNKRIGGSQAIASVVLGAITIFITIGMYVIVARMAVWGLASTSRIFNRVANVADSMSGKKTDKLLSASVDVKIGKLRQTTNQYGEQTMSVPVSVRNLESREMSYSIWIDAYNANGDKIASDVVRVINLDSKRVQDVDVFQYMDNETQEALKNATFKVTRVSTGLNLTSVDEAVFADDFAD